MIIINLEMENRDYLDIFNRISCGVQRQWEELLLECKGSNVSPMALGVMVLCHNLCQGLPVRLEKEQVVAAAQRCFSWLDDQSQNGCPSAQFVFAAFHELGIVVEKNLERAFIWFQKSANAGCVTSQCCVGVCYKEGRGVGVDLIKAAEYLQLAANANHARSQIMLAELLITNGERTEAIRLAMLGAEAGYSRGWYVIATMYLPTHKNCIGMGNMDEACKWLEVAANHNYEDAMCELGRILLENSDNGDANNSRWSRGLELYRQAIGLGSIEALNYLGMAHLQGQGVEQNNGEAMRLFKQAVDNGSGVACCNIGNIYHSGQGTEVDYIEAADWYLRSADAGVEIAMVSYGHMWWSGHGRPVSAYEAVKWYRKAAEEGDLMGMHYLGESLFDGTGVEMDKEEALKWISRAAEKGLQEAKDWFVQHGKGIVAANETA